MTVPNLSIVRQVEKVMQFLRWLPVSYTAVSLPLYFIIPSAKFLSYKFQIPAFILTIAINKYIIKFCKRKQKRDRRRVSEEKLTYELLD